MCARVCFSSDRLLRIFVAVATHLRMTLAAASSHPTSLLLQPCLCLHLIAREPVTLNPKPYTPKES